MNRSNFLKHFQRWCPSSVESHRRLHSRRSLLSLQVQWWRCQRYRASSLGAGRTRQRLSHKSRRSWSRFPKEPCNMWSTCSHANMCGVHVLVPACCTELWINGRPKFCSLHSFEDALPTTNKEEWSHFKVHHGDASQQVSDYAPDCFDVRAVAVCRGWGESETFNLEQIPWKSTLIYAKSTLSNKRTRTSMETRHRKYQLNCDRQLFFLITARL